MKLKKGDIVAVTTGKDKATKGTYKTGEILQVFPDENKVLVKGINIVTKHYRPSNARPNGGIEKKEAPIDASNVMLVVDGKATRVGFKMEGDKKVRICRKCKERGCHSPVKRPAV